MADINHRQTTITSNMDILPTSEGWVSNGVGMTVSSGILTYYAAPATENNASYYTLMADATKTKIIEARISVDSNSTGEFRLGINDGTRATFLIFNGIDKTGNIAYYNRSSIYTNISTGINFSGYHIYRVELDSINGLKVYIDGVQTGSTVSYSLLNDTTSKSFIFSSRIGTVYYDWVKISDPTNIDIDLSKWKYKKQITIPNTSIDADLTNFPLPVYLDSTNFDFNKTRIDGSDIKFTDLNNNLLKFERKDQGISYTPYTNMILNPGFESGATSWLGISTAITVSTTAPYTGVNCVKNLNGTIWATAYQIPAATAGHIYYANLAYKVIVNNSTAFAVIIALDSISTQLASSYCYSIANTTQPTWKKASAILTAPANTATMQFLVNDYNASDTLIESYADDCVLVDLTALYGAGNEPTQAWCDANIDVDGSRFINSGKMKDKAVFNVQVPKITDIIDTSIYMYYGKNTLTAKTYKLSEGTYSDKTTWDALFITLTDTREWQVPAQGIYWKGLSDLNPPNALLPPEPTLQVGARYNGWSAEGKIYIPSDGTYSFCINSDDGGEVKIDDNIVTYCYTPRGAQGSYELAIAATVPANTIVIPMVLGTGWHTFIAKMNNGLGGYSIGVGWKKPGDTIYSTIPGSYFSNDSKLYTEIDNYNSSIESWQDQTGKQFTYNGNAKLQGGYSYGNDYINLLSNPWFNNGLDTWGSGGFTPSTLNGVTTFKATGQWNNLGSTKNIIVAAGDIVYYGGRVLTTTSDTRLGLGLNSLGGSVFTTSTATYGTGNFELTSGRYTTTGGYESFYFAAYDVLASAWQPVSIKECFVINLTKWFGAGNEPTQAWCDINIANKPKRSLNLTGTLYTNMITNNTFDAGVTGWASAGTGTMTASANARTGAGSMALTGTTGGNEIYAENTGISFTQNSKYYFSCYAKCDTVNIGVVNLDLYMASTGYAAVYSSTGLPLTSYWQRKSAVLTFLAVSGTGLFRIDFNNVLQTGSMYVDDVYAVNLTALFGAGNEPTQAWCDANIGVSPSYLTVPNSSDLNFTGDFTFEWWENKKFGTGAQSIIHQYSGSNDFGILMGYAGTLCYISGDNASWNSVAAFNYGNAALLNQWVHRALVRNGNMLYGYENGILYNSVAMTVTPYFNSAQVLNIGKYQYSTSGYMNGTLNGMRITNGFARYISNFTPPTSFTIDSPQVVFCTNFDTIYDSNYQMVQHMGDNLIDATGNGNNGTATGTTIINTAYGKSRLFNGTSEQILTSLNPSQSIGGNKMSFIGMVYPTSAINYKGVAGYHSNYQGMALFQYVTDNWQLTYGNGTSWAGGNGVSTLALNQWDTLGGIFDVGYANGNVRTFKSGTIIGSPVSSPTPISHLNLFYIGKAYGDADRFFKGNIGEIRISDTNRLDAWIKAESLGIKNTLLIYGIEMLNGSNRFWFGLNF